tara:strand:+ start:2370 stop:3770 length:1401 start_codon:yes stop_codon:yes gene_type:complete
MAVRDSEKLLENLLNYVNGKNVRNQIDNFQEIVTLEKSNLVECWKDGYNVLKKKHKNKDLDSGETWDWNKGVDQAWPLIQASLETFRSITVNSRLSNNNTIVFTSSKNNKRVYDTIKNPSVKFIEENLKRKLTVAQDEIDANPGKFLDNKGKANYQAAAAASDVGLIKSSTVRLHRQGSTVGAGQYITAMKWIEKTKFFKNFLTSDEYKTLQDKYGPLKLNYVASGTKKRGLIISPNEDIQIDISTVRENSKKEKTDWKKIKPDLVKAIKDWALKSEIAGKKGSKSIIENTVTAITLNVATSFESKKNLKVDLVSKNRKTRKKSKASITKKSNFSPKSKSVAKVRLTGAPQRSKTTRGVSSYPLQLIALLNRDLPNRIRNNMTEPSLVNRTGRFSESVKVTDIIKTPRGYPSIGYTYQRDPYEVFEMGNGDPRWATRSRDPRKLIDRSIREVASQYALGRFYTRRV